jgi:hypothetical protein
MVHYCSSWAAKKYLCNAIIDASHPFDFNLHVRSSHPWNLSNIFLPPSVSARFTHMAWEECSVLGRAKRSLKLRFNWLIWAAGGACILGPLHLIRQCCQLSITLSSFRQRQKRTVHFVNLISDCVMAALHYSKSQKCESQQSGVGRRRRCLGGRLIKYDSRIIAIPLYVAQLRVWSSKYEVGSMMRA